MIKIIYTENCLTISGHSNFETKGKDIVCAAVSALVCGSIQIWQNNKNFLISQNIKTAVITISLISLQNNQKEKIELDFLFFLLNEIKKTFPKYLKILKN